MMAETYPCPVCDFPQQIKPWAGDIGGSQEICQSCGIQYGYTDNAGGDVVRRKLLHQAWRKAWIENGRKELDKDQQLKVITEVVK